MKKMITLVMAALICLSMLAVPALASDVTEISFWTWRPEDTAFYDAVIADFEAANPDIKLVISGGGSGNGIKALGEKQCDVAMSSRDIKDK